MVGLPTVRDGWETGIFHLAGTGPLAFPLPGPLLRRSVGKTPGILGGPGPGLLFRGGAAEDADPDLGCLVFGHFGRQPLLRVPPGGSRSLALGPQPDALVGSHEPGPPGVLTPSHQGSVCASSNPAMKSSTKALAQLRSRAGWAHRFMMRVYRLMLDSPGCSPSRARRMGHARRRPASR